MERRAPDPNGSYQRFLQGGAALVLGADAEILAHASSLPPSFQRNQPLLGRRPPDLEPPALGDLLQRLWERSRSGGEASTAELVLSDATAPRPVFVSLRVAPHADAPELTLVTLRDLTGERQRVRTLLERNEELEGQRAAWEDAARTLAHDVRSSLGALTGFVRIALERSGEVPPLAAESLGKALEIAERIRTRTRAVGADGGADFGAPEPVDLGQLAVRLFGELRAAHPETSFTWCAEATQLRAAASVALLGDVLWNLLTNAVNYRSPDRVLHIELGVDRRGDEVHLEVRDNGVGLEDGQEELVFRRGWRGRGTRGVEGSGLGLFSVRRLVEECGGRAWARRLPCGAAFAVALPAWEEPKAG